MKILILGATGFIGSHITTWLATNGHEVTGLGRSVARARARQPNVSWLQADLSQMLKPSDWHRLLASFDAVVNCAGALQDGLNDKLAAVQTHSQLALYEAAKETNLKLIVQISAETTGSAGSTAFLNTKRRADEVLAESGLPYIILRPSLVIGRNAFGGTALLRALAAFPGVLPLIHAESPTATVALDDVARVVSQIIEGQIPTGTDMSLASDKVLSLQELVALHRQWLGLPDAPVVSMPAALARPVSYVADLLGRLGWRSPLRSTAMQVMRGGVSASTNQNLPFTLETAAAFLARNPAGVQDIWTARLYLLKPLVFFVLSAFWIASGIIPLTDVASAAERLQSAFGAPAALFLTYTTCLLDVFLGAALTFRPTARLALWGMLTTTFAYVAGSLIIEPAIWLDPLGAMVKTIPAAVLTLIALATLDER